MSAGYGAGVGLSGTIRRLAVLILLFWVGLAAITNAVVPRLEEVAKQHNVAMSPGDAPSMQAMKRIGEAFHEFDSDNAAMIVLEGDEPLREDAHRYYDTLVQQLAEDTEHVEHVQNFWGDPLTAAGVQSTDGKAAYLQVYLAGNQGEALSNESVAAVRDIVAATPPPNGVRAYVTGAGPLLADQFGAGSKGTVKVTMITLLVIAVMLFFVYRSVATMALVLVMVFVQLAAARGIVALLADSGIIGLSVYATNLLTLLVIAAGTDYAIFFIGRYQESRGAGEDRTTAYHTMFHGTAHVVLGSGLTIAGAVYCLSFTRLPYFNSLGSPVTIAVLVALVAALTLIPAVLTVGSRLGLFEPRHTMRTRGWRRIGTAVARWPGPILTVTGTVSVIGLLALPGYETSYDVRHYIPASAPANIGYAAAERHFPSARLHPELLLVEADHDLRNPADMLILERIAREVFRVPGVAQVQSITRPLGTPIDHSSIPFQISLQNTGQVMNLTYQRQRADDMLKQADELTKSIDVLKHQYTLQQELAATTHDQAESFQEMTATLSEIRDNMANLDDFLRPIRNYFYWEPHCYNLPSCSAARSAFEALDGVDRMSGQLKSVGEALEKLNAIQPQLVELMPGQITSQETNRELLLSSYSTMSGIYDQMAAMTGNSMAMGQAFDAARIDDFFYLPPEAFDNPDFQRGLTMFLSPDGHAARMIITHDGDPATPAGIARIDPIKNAANVAVKGTPLQGAEISVAGTAATYKDIQDGAKYDLMIAAVAALSLILLIMMFITRSLVAAIVIVGTVALSLGASFGLSVLVWQHIFGIPLYWIVLALAVVVLLGVGSDYNLLLISRFKEEIGAGIKTGMIRTMAGTGSVVTAAGLVFAATMSSFVFSDLRVLGQIGSTIGLGLLFDTLIVRAFMTPSIAVLLGRWFWWPQRVRPRPAPQVLRP
ncbi:RND family transporter [[Mycobacterium] burgundiense]|uniref:MMPL family transporter n=1 Tax=[Mycobacterium] burgundiense TaxID=3064286 RepID=A0ABM9LXS4_9MYCO|nr:MMPL family transporter [Mycolicibacterium sp. MU0053]CAJ1506491.1 MMPL family transporter [Mycolicibacterium sp. MU0053]